MGIEDFPLAWRWTRKTHSIFSAEALASMNVLEPAEVAELNETGIRLFPANSNSDSECFTTRDSAIVQEWLESLSISPESPTQVVWDKALGIQLPWGLFAENWDDFCYPSSDDVYIFPPTKFGAIAYEHIEQFRYSKYVV